MTRSRPGAATRALAVAALAMSWTGTPAQVIDAVSPAELAGVLGALRGQVVILNVWATWCAPCLKEIPDLLAVEAELRDEGLVLLGLAIDDPADAAEVERVRQQHFPGFRTVTRAGGDADSMVSVVDPAWNEVVPTTYLLGRDGGTLQRLQGKLSRQDLLAVARRHLRDPARQ